MSNTRKSSIAIILLTLMLSFFMFGCKKEVEVSEIYFDLQQVEQLVLVEGEVVNLADFVEIKPANASNKKYSLETFDEEVVKIENGEMLAVREGTTQIRVVSEENSLKEDLMSVVVVKTQIALSAPKNLTYDAKSQSFEFDAVSNATSYAIKINDEVYELGNTRRFDLEKCGDEAFNNVLNVQVKANAPTWTSAFLPSAYGDVVKIYQVSDAKNLGVVGGKMTFEKGGSSIRANVYFNDEIYLENSSEREFSFVNLNETYAGKNIDVAVELVLNETTKTNLSALNGEVKFYPSHKKFVNVDVLSIPNLDIKTSTLYLLNTNQGGEYKVYIDGILKSTINGNSFDLTNLIGSEKVHEVEVEPEIKAEHKNVFKTNTKSKIKVQQLVAPVLSVGENEIEWQNVENKTAYSVTINDLPSLTTGENKFSMAGYEAGNYTIVVQAVAKDLPDENGVHYLTSKVNELTFSKQADVAIEVVDYELRLLDLGTDNASVLINRIISENVKEPVFSSTIEGQNSIETLDLGDMVFAPGAHEIVVSRLGISTSVNGKESVHPFVQLEKVSDLKVENGKIEAERSDINSNADITIEITGGTLSNALVLPTNSSTLNTTDRSETDNFIGAGEYLANVFVDGNGSTTFAYREGGVVVATTQPISFGVLEIPTLSVLDTAKTTLTIGTVANASKYNVFKVTEGEYYKIATETELVDVEFTLDGEAMWFAVQAVEANYEKTYLQSEISAPIGVVKLVAPTLTFDNENNVVKKQDSNDETVVEGYHFTKDKEDFNYDFSSSLTLYQDVVFGLETIAKTGKFGDNYYLNSDVTTLKLTKLDSGANLSINENNQLVIISDETRECDLEVVFDCGGEMKVFKGTAGTISDGTGTLNYSYQTEENVSKYIVNLIDDKFNLYVKELINEFSAKVRFSKSADDDKYITSEFSSSKILNVVRLSSPTTIDVDAENKITISPMGHEKQYGIIVMFNDDNALKFVGNGTDLVCEEMKLPYSFNDGKYSIEILDEKFNLRVPVLTGDFKIKVKYIHDLSGTEADLDSVFCVNQKIELLSKANLIRDGQNIKFNNVKETYDLTNYSLLINETCVLQMSESEAVLSQGYYVFEAEFIFGNSQAQAYLQDVNSVEVVVTNLQKESTLPVLANKGEKINIHKSQTVTISVAKNNDSDNKSAVISFEKFASAYNKEYVIEIAQNSEIKKTIRYMDGASENIISFNLDDIDEINEVMGEIVVSARVTTTDNYIDTETIEVFSSSKSNEIKLEKLAHVSNLKVSNSVLLWDSLENIVGYEVYEKTNNSYLKLNKNLLLENKFEFTNVSGDKEVVVKAISVATGYSNSYYSESVNISKLATPTLAVENGKFKAVLPSNLMQLLANEKVKIIPETNNAQKGVVEFNLNDVDGKMISFNPLTMTVIIEPCLALAYNSETVMKEDLSFQIRVEQTEAVDGVYYLNSNKVNISAYGLKKDKKVSKTVNDNSVELITWEQSDKNKILVGGSEKEISVAHVFKMQYVNGDVNETYYSNDPMLRYYDKTTNTYVSYPTYLANTSVLFPAGYGEGEDEKPEIYFNEGTFKFSFMTVPSVAIEGFNLCNSSFTEEYVFDILKKPTPTVETGVLKWEKQDKASKYVVSVFAGDNATATVTDTVWNVQDAEKIEYGFLNSKMKGMSGVFRVIVKAISNTDDAVSSVESEPVYVYRLHEATDLAIDDGHLILSANKFFTEAKFEFVDGSNNVFLGTYAQTEKASENLADLNLETWKSFDDVATMDTSYKCKISLDEELLSQLLNTDYTINVTLVGNTNNGLGIISSSKAISLPEKPLQATKLRPNVVEVEKGTLKFVVDSDYATITENGIYSGLDFNYSFNGATSSAFWHNTAVYRLDLEYSLGKTSIYAVDYYSFMTAFGESINNGITKTEEYEIIDVENLYARVIYPYGDSQILSFNVFKNNTIDLLNSANLNFYQMREHDVNGVNNLEMEKEDYRVLSLVDGGSWTFNVYMVGGDSIVDGDITVGHFTASAFLVKTFNRYSTNELNSNNGKIQFVNLLPRVNGIVIDNPVYRLVAKEFGNLQDEGKIFYLFHNSKEDAQKVATRFEASTVESATFVQVETVENDENALLFDMAQYVDGGTYSVNIQTLAGLGIGVDDSDYLLNGQISTYDYPVYKLSSTALKGATLTFDGQLTFAQSYILVDNGKQYHENYEITLIDDETSQNYIYQINRTSQGVKIDDANHVVYYDLPSEILPTGETESISIGENKNYRIKVRAVATTSAQDNLVINAVYEKEADADKTLTIKKSEGISSLKVGEGILRWVVRNPETHVRTAICLVGINDVTGEEITFAEIVLGNDNKVVDGQGKYLYHAYDFTDSKYDYLATGSGEIKDGWTYKICAYVTNDDEENCVVLNSNRSESITAKRLKKVDNIKTVDGVLTWSEVEGATGYYVSISGTETHNILVTEPTLDLIANDIKLNPNGTYYVQIKAKDETDDENSKLDAMNSSLVGEFIKLNVVDRATLQIDGFKISWQKVANAQEYNVKLIYNDESGQEQNYLKDGLVLAEFEIPEEIQGTIVGSYAIEITANGTTNEKLFNGEAKLCEIEVNPPANVEEFFFDETTQNRFVIKVKHENFKATDKFVITYNFKKYLPNADEQTTIPEKKIVGYGEGNYEIKEEYYYYYLPMTVMGYYSNLGVQVTRPNTLPSIVVSAKNGDKDFRIYHNGSGEETDPYCIFSATELLNIKYFSKTKSHFAIRQAIDMSGVDINAELNNNNGALIADEFNGTLTGGENWFIYFSPNASTRKEQIVLENQHSFALFNKLESAKISYLTFGQTNYELILSNTFAFDLSNMLKLSLIATSANNSTISNIKIDNLKIEILCNSTTDLTHKGMQISAVVNEANSSKINNSNVNLRVEIVNKMIAFDSSASTSVGGVVAVANNADVDSSNVTLSVVAHKDNTIKYLGGVFASFVATNKTHGIASTTVNVTSSQNRVLNFGGLAGFARNIKIDACDVVVAYAETSIIHGINLGGLIGYSQNAVISNSGTSVDFDITLTGLENMFIGSLVGFLTIETTTDTSTITNCYNASFDETNPVFKTNLLNGSQIELGVYGNAITDRITVSGIRKNK